MSEELRNKALNALTDTVDAGRPIIYVQTPEEDRVLALLNQMVGQQKKGKPDVFVWSITEGLTEKNGRYKTQPEGARGMLDFAVAYPTPAIFLLKDFHDFLQTCPDVRRRLRDAYYECLNSGKFLFISSRIREATHARSGRVGRSRDA
jgi:hypothetical protein